MKAEREARLAQGGEEAAEKVGAKAWFRDSWVAIKANWVLC